MQIVRESEAKKQERSTVEFFTAIFPPGTPGDIVVFGKTPPVRFISPTDEIKNLTLLASYLDRVQDVYFSVNTMDGAAIRVRGEATRGKEIEVKAVCCFCADIDAEGKPGHNYPPQTSILESLAEMPLAPLIVNLSGRENGGLHAIWLLDRPAEIHDEAQRARIKALSARWQALLRSKLEPYELDATHDLARVLAPSGTRNHKYATIVTALTFEPGRRYSLDEFEAVLPPEPPPAPLPPRPVPLFAVDHLDVIDQARRALAALPFAVAGNHGHNATFRPACLLIKGFDLSPFDALPLLREWNSGCSPPWSIGELMHKLTDADAARDDKPRGYRIRRPPEKIEQKGNTSGTGPARSGTGPVVPIAWM